MKNKSFIKGFTLIELTMYIGLVSIVMGGAVLFGWDAVLGKVKSRAQQEVSSNIRFAAKRIVYEIRNATAINSLATDDLCLAMADASRNPTRIYVSGERLTIGWGGGGSCAAVTNTAVLTSNLTRVQTLRFQNISSLDGKSKNIQFSITVASNNPGGKKAWDAQDTIQASAEIRSN